jgi:hypothetical protein
MRVVELAFGPGGGAIAGEVGEAFWRPATDVA